MGHPDEEEEEEEDEGVLRRGHFGPTSVHRRRYKSGTMLVIGPPQPNNWSNAGYKTIANQFDRHQIIYFAGCACPLFFFWFFSMHAIPSHCNSGPDDDSGRGMDGPVGG